MRIDDSIVVRRPLDDVFDFYADPMGGALVDPRVRVTVLADGPVGVGTRSRVQKGRQTFEVEITEYERPAMLSFRMSMPGRSETIDITQRFAAAPDGTRVSTVTTYDIPGRILRGLFRLAGWYVRRTIRGGARRIAAVAEARLAGPTP